MPILVPGTIRFLRRRVACLRVQRRVESPEKFSRRRHDYLLIRRLGPTTPD
jgi:hypothetical protein